MTSLPQWTRSNKASLPIFAKIKKTSPLHVPFFRRTQVRAEMLRRLHTRVPRRASSALPISSCAKHRFPPALSYPARSIQPFSSTPASMIPPLPTVDPPVSAAFPADSFQLLAESDKAGAAEDALYEQELKDVEAWWASPRYQGIKRPYSASDVVSKRGSLQQTYPSSVMARKLWNLIQERGAKGEPIHTSERPRGFSHISVSKRRTS